MTIKKVLFQLNQVGFGGTEKAILSFAENLDRSKFEPFLFIQEERFGARYWRYKFQSVFSQKSRQRFTNFYISRYVREESFKKAFGVKNVFYGGAKELEEVIKHLRPDIFHINRGEEVDFYTELVERLPAGIRIVESSIFGKTASKAYLSRLDRFFFISKWLSDQHKWADNKSRVVYLPIRPSANQENLRRELGIAEDAIVIGRAQRPDLGQDDFLEQVFTPVLRSGKYKIVLLGLGHHKFYSEKFSFEFADSIKNLAPTTDESRLSHFYNTLDILTHRRMEGETFGMIVAEAMIHGKPVISHLSPVDNAQVEVIGDSHWITQFEDVNTYRSRLLELVDSSELRKTTGLRNLRRATEIFHVAKVTKDLETEYSKLF